MSAISTFKPLLHQRLDVVRRQQPGTTGPGLLLPLLRDLADGVLTVVAARLWLRGAELGRRVSVKGRPLYRNAGRLILGDRVRILSDVQQAKLFVSKGGVLRLGEGCRINGAHISASNLIDIGPYSVLMDDDYHQAGNYDAAGKSGAIRIGNNVWIATGVTILKGVTIGDGASVATGAVVTKDVPPYTLVAGVPAKVIRQLRHD